MHKFKKIYMTTAVCAGIFGLTGCGQVPVPAVNTTSFPDTIHIQNEERNVITVQSSEEVKVVPDMAEIDFGVLTQEKDAKTCQDKNNEELSKVIQFLKDFGISEESLQTSNYGMNPIYDWNSGQAIIGYQMETNLTVSDISIEQTGALLSACVEAGINNIDRVSYLSSQYDACYQEALSKAIEASRKKAEVMAQASGCTLGSVVHIEEYLGSQEARYNSYSAARKEMSVAMAEDMAVEAGQLSIEAKILVEFSIDEN